MSTLTLGLIGASFVAASRMVPAFSANGITPTALFDTEPARFEHWRDHGLKVITTDLDEFIASGVDVIYISSRNDQHTAHAIAALDVNNDIDQVADFALHGAIRNIHVCS